MAMDNQKGRRLEVSRHLSRGDDDDDSEVVSPLKWWGFQGHAKFSVSALRYGLWASYS